MPAEASQTGLPAVANMVAKPEDVARKVDKCGTFKTLYMGTGVLGTGLVVFGAAQANRLLVLMGVMVLIFSIIEHHLAVRMSVTCQIVPPKTCKIPSKTQTKNRA